MLWTMHGWGGGGIGEIWFGSWPSQGQPAPHTWVNFPRRTKIVLGPWGQQGVPSGVDGLVGWLAWLHCIASATELSGDGWTRPGRGERSERRGLIPLRRFFARLCVRLGGAFLSLPGEPGTVALSLPGHTSLPLSLPAPTRFPCPWGRHFLFGTAAPPKPSDLSWISLRSAVPPSATTSRKSANCSAWSSPVISPYRPGLRPRTIQPDRVRSAVQQNNHTITPSLL
jgi:hypothetical protein